MLRASREAIKQRRAVGSGSFPPSMSRVCRPGRSAGNVCGIDEAVAAPAGREQPRPCPRDRTARERCGPHRFARRRCTTLPAVEAPRRRCRIETHARSACRRCVRLCGMPPRIQQHVPQRPVHLARRQQEPEVIALRKHRSLALHDPIDGTCQARADRHHAAAKRCLIARFHDQMRVIPLQRVVHDPELGSLATVGEGAFDHPHDAHVAKRRKTSSQTQRHVRRQRSPEWFACDVRHRRTLAALASGARPSPAPTWGFGQGECELRRAVRHLEYGYLYQIVQELSRVSTRYGRVRDRCTLRVRGPSGTMHPAATSRSMLQASGAPPAAMRSRVGESRQLLRWCSWCVVLPRGAGTGW